MSGCTDTQKLYQLPGFFAHVAAVLSSDRNSQFFVSEVFFPKPDYPRIAPASERWKSLREQSVSIDKESTWNEYGEALKRVSDYPTRPEERHVVLLFTDGTFSQPGGSKKEEQEIEQELRNLKRAKNAEVYLIFCNHPNSLEAWRSLTITNMLSGTFGVDKLPEWIDDLGNALFGEWLEWLRSYDENIQMGWITATSTVNLPAETITFTVDIIPHLIDAMPAWIDHMGQRYDLKRDSTMVLTLEGTENERGFLHSKPNFPCKPRDIRLNLKNSVGLYRIRAYRIPLVEELRSEISVNHQPATVTFSLKASPDFEPSNFVKCYSVELTSTIANGSGQFQNSHSTLALTWQPSTPIEPGDYPGTLHLKNREGRDLVIYPITLPVRFQPIPSDRTATKELVKKDDIDLYQMKFKYKYIPPGVQPQIFLCCRYTPEEIKKRNQELACGKDRCCSADALCSITCPIPTPCSPEVRKFCDNCVPVVFNNLCAPERIAIASQDLKDPNPPQFTQTYTLTLYNCPAEEDKCGYTGLIFFWPEGPKVVSTTHYFKRSGDSWILQQP